MPEARHPERPRRAGRVLTRSVLAGLLLALLAPAPASRAGGAPQRIVALAPSAAEILVALGAAERVVAVPDAAAGLPGMEEKVRIGGFVPDLERIVALRPDLVVASRDGTDRGAFEKLESLGIPVLATDARSLDGVLADIRRVGGAIGAEEEAARLVASLSERIAAAERRAAGRRGPAPRALVVIWPDPPVVAGPGTFVGDLLVRARFVNVVPGKAGEWPRVSFETLAVWNPDVVVRPATRENEAAVERAFTGNGPWRLVPAVHAGRVVEVPGDLLERPGPRLVDALELLAALPPSGRTP